jgi:hypothetical protein
VRDRERKWLARNTQAGRFKRRLEYEADRRARRARRQAAKANDDWVPGTTGSAGRRL